MSLTKKPAAATKGRESLDRHGQEMQDLVNQGREIVTQLQEGLGSLSAKVAKINVGSEQTN